MNAVSDTGIVSDVFDFVGRIDPGDLSHRKDAHMDDYPLIADHGLIGDLQTAALVTTDGSVD